MKCGNVMTCYRAPSPECSVSNSGVCNGSSITIGVKGSSTYRKCEKSDSLQGFGDIMDEFAGIRTALAILYTDYYSSQKILITYKQKISEENVPIYFSKLFNLPLDVAYKKYPFENYDLTVELAYYNNAIF